MKVIYVKWIDVQAHHSPVRTVDALEKTGVIMHSAGILIAEDEGTIRITQDVYKLDGDEENCRDLMIIPKQSVLKVQYFEVDD